MTESALASKGQTPEQDTPASPPVPDDLGELRSLILGPELDEIDALRTKLEDPATMARAMSPALPDAIALRGNDPQLAKALAPSIEQAITVSVRRNPHPLADALFPVMGPAIRSAISHALATMLESFNRTIEQSVSWRALRWRLQAFRTGKPFAEIVLLNTLEYRVEQVFLIHRETGLLLQRVAVASAGAHDADMVSAMLTAIRDFVRDSFGAGSGEALDALRVGEVSVFVEQGPSAIIAAMARGLAPQELRVALQDALETIHLQFATELMAYSGDSHPFVPARPILEGCLLSSFRKRRSAAGSRRWIFVAAAAGLALLAWIGLSSRDGRRWNRYLDRLRAQPGIVVLDATRRGGIYTVSGLRDPLAIDPTTLIAASGLAPDRVIGHWQLHQTLDPRFVLLRANQILRPPSGVTLHLNDGILLAAGTAPVEWVLDSERVATLIAGVRRFDSDVTRAAEQTLKQQIETTSLNFHRGGADLVPGQEEPMRRLVEALQRANALAHASGRRVQLRVEGHTDTDGAEALNAALSTARAAATLARLTVSNLAAVDAIAVGIGSSRPLTPGTTDLDKQRNRRVSFTVTFTGRDETEPQR